jgi:hypothetical protein
LPGAKVGRGWRFLEADLLAWIRSNYPDGEQPGGSASDLRLRFEGGQDVVAAGPREATERALDALLESPTIGGAGRSSAPRGASAAR